MSFILRPRGEFSLAAATRFAEAFPGTIASSHEDELRFAWAVDDDWRIGEVSVRQTPKTVRVQLRDIPSDSAGRAREDVERILCLDVDGTGFATIGERDPVVGALQRRYPGLRPVLFYTPYEAAAWAIIGHRIRMNQAAAISQRLAEELGSHGAFPGPDELLSLTAPQRGLTNQKLGRLRTLAEAALNGALGRTQLRAMGAEKALQSLQRLPGVGPFSAELIWVRGVEDPDWLPRHEPRLIRATHAAYPLAPDTDIEAVSDGWRPYRGWVALLLRKRLDDENASGPGHHGRPILESVTDG